MPSSPTTRNRLEKQATGENSNTWGAKLNAATFDLIDAALDGMASYALSGAKSLTSTNYVADESRMPFQNITSGTGGTVTVPAVEKRYYVRNNATGDVIFTTGGGATATVRDGDLAVVLCDGTNCYTVRALDYGAELPSSTGTPTSTAHLVTKAYADGLSFSSALPDQTGNSGKYLTTDGTTASWATLTKTTVGLANVDNTADSAKPVSTAQQTALDAKADKTVSVVAGTGLTGGGTLAADRTIGADIASQAEAQAGTLATKLMTPERVSQAIDALSPNNVVIGTKTDAASTTAASWTDTGLTATITLGAATSRVLVRASMAVAMNSATSGVGFRLVRGVTTLLQSDTVTEIEAHFAAYASAAELLVSACGEQIDAPGNVGPHTYKVQWYVPAGTGYLNSRSGVATSFAGASTLTLQELAA